MNYYINSLHNSLCNGVCNATKLLNFIRTTYEKNTNYVLKTIFLIKRLKKRKQNRI